MNKEPNIQKFIDLVKAFAESNDEVLALGLCGSWANGTATSDSDIDFILVVRDPEQFKIVDWIHNLKFGKIDEKIDYFEDHIYGVVWSRHIFLESNTEIEFTFARSAWADIKILDPGTEKVVTEAFVILHDPELLLHSLINHLK